MRQQYPDEPENVNLLDPSTVLDDRVKLSDAARKRLAAKGLQFSVPPNPIPVIMMDPHMHTPDFMTCADPECICHELERERHIADHEAAKPQRPGRRKILARATYEPPHGDLGCVSRPFKLMR